MSILQHLWPLRRPPIEFSDGRAAYAIWLDGLCLQAIDDQGAASLFIRRWQELYSNPPDKNFLGQFEGRQAWSTRNIGYPTLGAIQINVQLSSN